MMQMTFPNTLRAAALLIVLAMAIRYLLLDLMMAIPLVTVALLVLLSISHRRWPRASAAISLVPGMLIPIFVLVGYLRGRVELALVVFDWLVLGWIVWSAIRELRRDVA